MADTGVRIGPLDVAVGASVDLGYTAPAGGANIVYIHAIDAAGATHLLNLSINGDAAATRIFSAQPVNPDIPLSYKVMFPMVAGETLEAGVDVAGCTLTIGLVEN